MKIFCVGLSKTATHSLTKALNQLNIRTGHYKYTDLNKIIERKVTKNDLKQYNAISDITVVYCYKELDKTFPNSKFIYTTRDKNEWLESCENAFPGNIMKKYKGTQEDIIFNKIYNSSHFDKDKFSTAYDNHDLDVMKYFKNRPDDILIINLIKESGKWKKICQFLNKPIPVNEFPNWNPKVR